MSLRSQSLALILVILSIKLQHILATWLSLRGGRPFLLLSRSFSLCCLSFSRSRDLDLLDLRSLDLDRRLLSRDLDLDRRRLFGDLKTNIDNMQSVFLETINHVCRVATLELIPNSLCFPRVFPCALAIFPVFLSQQTIKYFNL